METMVLLVFLAIVWAAVGVYWLRTRAPQMNMSIGGGSRRMSAFDMPSSRKSAPVVSMRSMATPTVAANVTQLRPQQAPGRPGHSLTEPARRAELGTQQTRGVTSEQARVRRRNVLFGLAAAAFLSLVGVIFIGGTSMILFHLLLDAMLLGYVMVLVQYQRAIEHERTSNLPVYATPRNRLASTGTDGRY